MRSQALSPQEAQRWWKLHYLGNLCYFLAVFFAGSFLAEMFIGWLDRLETWEALFCSLCGAGAILLILLGTWLFDSRDAISIHTPRR